MLNDYLPEKLSRKWQGHTATLLEVLAKCWEISRPRKGFFSFGFIEPDSRLDQMTPVAEKRILHYEGSVVMGHFARAFFPAYIPGTATHYGSVVYSIDPVPADSLFELAWRVNELRKDSSPPPSGTENVALAIRDDQSQFARIMLPPSVSGLERAYFGNICVHRSRLPLGYLHDRLVPLLVAPGKSEWCTLLPLRFWDDKFKSIWSSGPPAYDPEPFKAQCYLSRIQP